MLDEGLYKTSMISIDSYENRVLIGRINNPFLEENVSFHSTMEFLREMNALLQDVKLPQSYCQDRGFHPVQEREHREASLVPPTPIKGRLATFSLRIMFRQNASWQGSLVWVDGKKEENFRSVLELLMLIDSALDRVVA